MMTGGGMEERSVRGGDAHAAVAPLSAPATRRPLSFWEVVPELPDCVVNFDTLPILHGNFHFDIKTLHNLR